MIPEIAILLIGGAFFVAYANGANDNFKGVATLYGSGTLSYRAALSWATATTLLGSLASIALASKLVHAFSGKGLVPDDVAARPEFLGAVAFGAAFTVIVAALTGFPISTTHALTGGLLGAGLVTAGAELSWARLGETFFLPLAASPLIALVLTGVAHRLLGRFLVFPGKANGTRLRSSDGGDLILLSIPTSMAPGPPALSLASGEPGLCAEHPGLSLIVRREALIDALHVVSSGAVSFARGLNDTPKIVGVLVVIESLRIEVSLLAVGGVMALGGILNARKVAETMSNRITRLSRGDGFLANLATAGLVLSASSAGLPVSTTHVSCGALFGAGVASGGADTKVVRQILLSWVLTLPVAAASAALVIATF